MLHRLASKFAAAAAHCRCALSPHPPWPVRQIIYRAARLWWRRQSRDVGDHPYRNKEMKTSRDDNGSATADISVDVRTGYSNDHKAPEPPPWIWFQVAATAASVLPIAHGGRWACERPSPYSSAGPVSVPESMVPGCRVVREGGAVVLCFVAARVLPSGICLRPYKPRAGSATTVFERRTT